MSTMHGGRALVACVIMWAGIMLADSAKAAEDLSARKKEQRQRTDGQGDPLPAGTLVRLGSVRLRHGGNVKQLGFLAGGRTLASVGGDGLFHVWDCTSGKELSRYQFPVTVPPSIQPDIEAMQVRMIMARRGNFNRRMINLMELPAPAPCFSSDARLLAFRSQANAVRVIDLVAGKEIRRLEIKQNLLLAFVFSPDGKLLAGSDATEAVHLWDLATGKELRRLQGVGEPFDLLVFSPDGSLLAGATQNAVRLWDVASGKKLRKYEGHEHQVTALAIAQDNKQLASASMDQTVRLWEVDSEEEVRKFAVREVNIQALAFAPDGKTLAGGCADTVVRLWDPATGNERRKLAGHGSPVQALAFSPDSKTLATAGQRGTIRLWNAATGKESLPAQHPGRVVWLAISRDGRTVSLGRAGGVISRWDTGTGKTLGRTAGPDGEVLAEAFAPDGSVAALANAEGPVRLWDPRRGQTLRSVEGLKGPNYLMAFSPDGTLLASTPAAVYPGAVENQDTSVRVWKVANGKELYQLIKPAEEMETAESPLSALVFSLDGNILAGATADNQVRLWEMATGKERFRFRVNQGGVNLLLAFSPDGKWLASAGPDETVRVWNVLSGKPRRGFLGPVGKVAALAFSPSGRLLAAGGDDMIVRVWDVRTGKMVHHLEGHEGAVLALQFDPKGKVLVSGSADSTALVWDLTVRRPAARHDRIGQGQLDNDWIDLGSEDSSVAYQALARLVDHPAESIALLRTRLRPVTAADSTLVERFIEELDSPRYAVRESATRALQWLGDQALPAARRALAKKPSREAAKRLKRLLDYQEGPVTSPARLRALRAVELLEKIGNREAEQALAKLAGGAPLAELTRKARESLDRLARASALGQRKSGREP